MARIWVMLYVLEVQPHFQGSNAQRENHGNELNQISVSFVVQLIMGKELESQYNGLGKAEYAGMIWC